MMNQAMMNQLTLIWLFLLSDYVELNQVNHLVMPVNHLHNHLKLMVQYLIILHGCGRARGRDRGRGWADQTSSSAAALIMDLVFGQFL